MSIETAAEVEHEQWAHWTRHMLANLTPENIARWQAQVSTPYAELTEREKDSDREWVHRSIAAFADGNTLYQIDEAKDGSGNVRASTSLILQGILIQTYPER